MSATPSHQGAHQRAQTTVATSVTEHRHHGARRHGRVHMAVGAGVLLSRSGDGLGHRVVVAGSVASMLCIRTVNPTSSSNANTRRGLQKQATTRRKAVVSIRSSVLVGGVRASMVAGVGREYNPPPHPS